MIHDYNDDHEEEDYYYDDDDYDDNYDDYVDPSFLDIYVCISPMIFPSSCFFQKSVPVLEYR